MTVTLIELSSASGFHLSQGGRIHAGARLASAGRDGWHLKTFHARTGADVHADHWHVNTEAEELVSCVIGKIRLYLRSERPGCQGEEEEIRLTAGTAAVVPRGRWHRIQLDIPSTIMTITPPHGGRSERRAAPSDGACP